MKKVISLVLALMTCLSLCACGGNGDSAATPGAAAPGAAADDATQEPTTVPEKPVTKEEMLAVAEKYSMADIQVDYAYIGAYKDHAVKFCDKTLLLSGWIENIYEDHIKLFDTYGQKYITYFMDVYLPADELALLQKGQYITVVGNTTDEITDSEISMLTYLSLQMPDAYLVEDRVELTGTFKELNSDYFPHACVIDGGDSNGLYLVRFADVADIVDIVKLTPDQEIRFSAKGIRSDGLEYYYDAEILE